jgi:hypothetical protein
MRATFHAADPFAPCILHPSSVLLLQHVAAGLSRSRMPDLQGRTARRTRRSDAVCPTLRATPWRNPKVTPLGTREAARKFISCIF